MNKKIVITTDFIASHAWPTCPIPAASYLKNEHRHRFMVCMKWNVSHNDRDIEFLTKKQEIDAYIAETFAGRYLGSKSCEDLAEHLLIAFRAEFVSVFEDGENGAEVQR